MAHLEGVDHLSLTVTDLARSTDWYRRVFGLDVVAEVQGQSFRRTRLSAGGRMTLTLTSHDARTDERFSELRPGMDHVAFKLAVGEDIGSLERCWTNSEPSTPGSSS